MPVIRRTAEEAAKLFGTDHPFCVQRFQTDGKTIFAQMQEEESRARDRAPMDSHTIDLSSGQHVFDIVVSPFFKQFVYDVKTALVRQWYPHGQNRMILVDPSISFGEPTVAKFGVPTRALKRAAFSGQPFADIADWYGLPLAAVESAVRFEDSLSRAA